MASQGQLMYNAINNTKTLKLDDLNDEGKREYYSYLLSNNKVKDENAKKQIASDYSLKTDGTFKKPNALATLGKSFYGGLASATANTIQGVQDSADTINKIRNSEINTGNKTIDKIANTSKKAINNFVNTMPTVNTINNTINTISNAGKLSGYSDMTPQQKSQMRNDMLDIVGANKATQSANADAKYGNWANKSAN